MKHITRVDTAPTVEPVTLAEIKTHLRGIDGSDHDDMLENLIQTAREWVEAYLRRALVQQTRAVLYPSWPAGDVLEIPYPPIQSVTSVVYTDTDDTANTLSTDDYSADTDSEPGRVVLGYDKTWPSDTIHNIDYPIVITYVAGYDNDGASPPDYRANIPEAIKQAVKLHVELLYDRPLPDYANLLKSARDALLAPYRVWGS